MGVRKADNGDNRETRNLEGAYVGEDTKATIGRRGDIRLMDFGQSIDHQEPEAEACAPQRPSTLGVAARCQ